MKIVPVWTRESRAYCECRTGIYPAEKITMNNVKATKGHNQPHSVGKKVGLPEKKGFANPRSKSAALASTQCQPRADQPWAPPNRHHHVCAKTAQALSVARPVGVKASEVARSPKRIAKTEPTVTTMVAVCTATGDDTVSVTGPSAKVGALVAALRAQASTVMTPGNAKVRVGLWGRLQHWFA